MQETIDGSNAEFVLLDAGLVLPLPDDFSYEEGSVLVCNFGTAYGAVRNAFTFPGGTVVIWGLGPVGLNCIIVAKAFGLRVIGIDLSESRREIAASLDVEVIDGAASDLVGLLHSMTGGEGPDGVIDTTGVDSVHRIIVPAVKRGGTVVLVGLGHASMVGTVPQAILRQVTIKGSWIFDIADWNPMLQFVRDHKIDLLQTVDKTVSANRFVEMFVEADKALAGKIIFDWSDFSG
jgi:threonine dehydrogenase-like Zn-dependent dehydrogenase